MHYALVYGIIQSWLYHIMKIVMINTMVEAKWALCFDLQIYRDNVKSQLRWQQHIYVTSIKPHAHISHKAPV